MLEQLWNYVIGNPIAFLIGIVALIILFKILKGIKRIIFTLLGFITLAKWVLYLI